MRGGRSIWIDCVKGLGITLVVVGHVWRGIWNAELPIRGDIYHTIDGYIYSFHMPLFFFVAGVFLLSSAAKPGGEYFADKLRTIVYPYVLWTFLFAAAHAMVSRYSNARVDFLEVLRTMWWNPHAQFWFFYVLLLCLIVLYPLAHLSNRLAVPLILALLVVDECALHWVHLPPWGPLIQAMRYLPYVAAGAVLGPWLIRKSDWVPAMPALGVGVLLYVGLYFLIGAAHVPAEIPAVVGIVASLCLCLALARCPGANVLAYVGFVALAVYVAHIIAASGARIVLQRFLHMQSLALHVIVGTMAGLIVPIVVFEAVNRARFPYVFVLPKRKGARRHEIGRSSSGVWPSRWSRFHRTDGGRQDTAVAGHRASGVNYAGGTLHNR